MLALALRALTLLGLVGASCALFVQEITGDWLPMFVLGNSLTLANRQRLLVWMVAGAVIAVGAGLLVWWRKDVQRLRRLSHLASPGILIGLVPQLCEPTAWPTPFNVAIRPPLFRPGSRLHWSPLQMNNRSVRRRRCTFRLRDT